VTVFTALGAHIVDVLGRPVGAIPAGQGGALLEEIRMTAAGAAGGTAVDLARLGATVRSVGAVGEDALAAFLRLQLESAGVDTSRLVVLPGAQTSATVLPIRANGERPSLHVRGVTPLLQASDVPASALAGTDYLHVGGPDVLGPFAEDVLPGLLRDARAAGTVVSTDLLASAQSGTLERLRGVLTQTDHLLINADQGALLTGLDDVVEAATALRAHVPGVVVLTTGADGGVLVDADGPYAFPALRVPVVDTTGCGDAFSAGYLYALSTGRPPRDACRLGTACASMVVQVLGSDGITGLDDALALAARLLSAP
jgi:sugar/nucleoside kinase (ribokinase family)